MTASTETGRRMQKVRRVMEEWIAETDCLPDTFDIVLSVELSQHRVETSLELLEKNGTVRKAYHKPKVATLWVPTHMWESLLHSKQRPVWMDEHGLAQREKVEAAIREQEDELNRLRRIEELLYASGRTLEMAIATALEVLEVEELSADFDDPESWDFSFELGGVLYIAEAKGKGGAANKDDALQLRDWVQQYIDENPDTDPERLCGLVFNNHHRDLAPEDWWPENEDNPPLTQHAESTLVMGRCLKFLTTVDLFEVTAKLVNEEVTPADAREELKTRMRTKVVEDE